MMSNLAVGVADQAAGVGSQRLRRFVAAFATLLTQTSVEAEILKQGGALLAELVRVDDWLPSDYAQPHPDYYRQYVLHVDSLERFSVVSFVWGPSQQTPIHNHTVWGLVGVLRGAEQVTSFTQQADGSLVQVRDVLRLDQGALDQFSPQIGDIHQVSNAYDDRVSVSIHVYGGNIGAINRHVYAADGTPKPFISGYANDTLPNIWRGALPTQGAAS
jgi:predicted metal-dependent enzyme (double-stranded beta helix superfamily)